ncbi:hypothetical protein BLOT_014403 [Blomia tropicalis]|nr:hypothetical protein BLOT_014403 [Blomia tropicalis]
MNVNERSIPKSGDDNSVVYDGNNSQEQNIVDNMVEEFNGQSNNSLACCHIPIITTTSVSELLMKNILLLE